LKFDLEGKMKRGINANPQSEFRQRLPAQLAERELQHLELILANYVERSPESSRLPNRYWDMRVAQLDTDYDLVPTQSQRVAMLQRRLAQLDTAIESANHGANNEAAAEAPAEVEEAQPKRVAA
jgi:hypothetical protein